MRCDCGQFLPLLLRDSRRFGWLWDDNGTLLLYNLSHPEIALRVTEQVFHLVGCFAGPTSVGIDEALNRLSLLIGRVLSRSDIGSIHNVIAVLLKYGVLARHNDAGPAYRGALATAYANSRAIPSIIAQTVVDQGRICFNTTVLDIATGPGEFAFLLSRRSNRVTAIDISPDCIDVARREAHKRSSSVVFRCADANRLVFEEGEYDVITICQAMHWLDPFWATQGVYSRLAAHGTPFVCETHACVDSHHPFVTCLNYGLSSARAVRSACYDQIRSHSARLALLADSSQRLVLNGAWLFRQRRDFDIAYARAFFFDDYVARCYPHNSSPWDALDDDLTACAPEQLKGDLYWFLMKFERGL